MQPLPAGALDCGIERLAMLLRPRFLEPVLMPEASTAGHFDRHSLHERSREPAFLIGEVDAALAGREL